MIRKIIQIDEQRCNGCGACANACHEGAIGMADGTAKLLRDDYCDGLGDCLPTCPTGAISFVTREAAAYDAAAVAAKKQTPGTMACGCPGTQSKSIEHSGACCEPCERPSQLRQWPVQIKLVAPNAPYVSGAHLLIAATCTAYAYAGFHERLMQGSVTLVGCPKLDGVDYSEKLTQILQHSKPASITAVRMEVPCCGGLIHAIRTAMERSQTGLPLRVVTISTDGHIIGEETV